MPKLVCPHAITCTTSLLRLPPPTPKAAGRQSFASSRRRPLAQPRHGILTEPWLPSASSPPPVTHFAPSPGRLDLDGLDGRPRKDDHKPPDERVLKLGKTLRTLSPLLPTILYNTLPPEILSPAINLHLFPSTHQHLPTVKGRTLYRAALWTVPVAWSSVPLVGNVKLQILSERIVRAGTVLDPERRDGHQHDCGDERLVVRWRTEPRTESRPFHDKAPFSSNPGPDAKAKSPTRGGSPQSSTGANNHPHHSSNSKTGTNKGLSVLLGGDEPIFKLAKEEQFTGLFIFSFDEDGRILTHTIEHADDVNGWDRTAKFVTLTDWLIGKARNSLDPAPDPSPGLAMESYQNYNCGLRPERYRTRRR